MPSKAAAADDHPETEAKREFDQWRVAVDIVRRLREAGISCELGSQTATDAAIPHSGCMSALGH